MDIVYKGFIKRMEKANNDMMMDENSRSWYVLYTAPRLERKLMQHLTVAGYKTYCPMQTIYVNWNGKTKEIIVPFFFFFFFVPEIIFTLSILVFLFILSFFITLPK